MKGSGTVLFYNLSSEKGRKIRMLCVRLGLKIKSVEKDQYGEMIGALAGVKGFSLTGMPCADGNFEDEMLVMKGFTNTMLDAFLNDFRRMRIEPVALKAVLTESNSGWNSIRLHEELVKEHAAMNNGEA